MSDIVKRLRELADAVTRGPDVVASEFTMSVPARPERDADLVLSGAADEIERLRAQTRGDANALRMIAEALQVPEDERHDGGIMRAITELTDAEILATYGRDDGWREWVSVGTWLHPGDRIVVLRCEECDDD